MSKKLIALASAAALVLTCLVGVAPANAAITVAFATQSADGTGGTAKTPSATLAGAAADVAVPANNKLEFSVTAARSSLMKVTVTTVAGNVVTATSTGAIKILEVDAIGTDYYAEDAADVDYTSASGSQSLSITATTTSVVFYTFTTSTTAGSLTVSLGGNSRVVYFKGAAGAAYNVALKAPTFVPANTAFASDNLTATVTDVFGNAVENSAGVVTVGVVGNGASVDDTTPDWSATKKNYGSTVTTTGSGSFGISAAITSAPADVTGLAAANSSAFVTVNSGSSTTEITTLTARVAALTAQLAESRPKATSVTKKKYNTLARKWNAANPGARVALKK